MPVWLQILITSVVVPGAGFGLHTLYRVGAIMGRIDEKLDGHGERIDKLEATVYAPSQTRRRL